MPYHAFSRLDTRGESILITFENRHIQTPRQKLGIAFDIGNQQKQLLRRIGQKAFFSMVKHDGLFGGLRADA